MNPEFRRQLWLQFSTTRLILLPLLLAACFAAAYLSATSEPAKPMVPTAMFLFAALVFGMGTLATGASVMDEISDRTWDQQRMSAMKPWAMTWGKLAGASAYAWYGGALCLLVAVPGALTREAPAYVGKAALAAIFAGVMLHAFLIAINLQMLKAGSRVTRRGGAWVLFLLLILGSFVVTTTLRGESIRWWNQTFARQDFALASLALFAVCALVAAWRSMAEALAVRQLPWGWPLLALVATAYISGFAWGQPSAVVGVVGLSVCAVLTYFALLTEPQQQPLWQRVLNRAHDRQWRALLLQLPRWPTSLLLVFPFAGICALALNPETSGPGYLSNAVLVQPIAFAFLVARDCALALVLAFWPQSRKPVVSFAVLMLVLYALLPWLLRAIGGPVLAALVLPLIGSSAVSVGIAAIHLGLAVWLLRWRWLANTPHIAAD